MTVVRFIFYFKCVDTNHAQIKLSGNYDFNIQQFGFVKI